MVDKIKYFLKNSLSIKWIFILVTFVYINILLFVVALQPKKFIETNITNVAKTTYAVINPSSIPAKITSQTKVVINPTPTNPVIPSSGVLPTPNPTPTLTPSTPTTPPTPPATSVPTYTATTAYSSSNWSGYLATGSKFTGVSGNWTVPNVKAVSNLQTSADAAWIGIGGVSSQDLIQTGTVDSIDTKGNTYYFAFYELLPDYATVIPAINVNPGDKMSASIREVANAPGTWTISIYDLTQNESYTTSVTYASTYSSVEWIEEDPMDANGNLYLLPNFNKVLFTNSTAISGGNSVSLANLSPAIINLVDSRRVKMATPSAVTNYTDFTVTYLTSY